MVHLFLNIVLVIILSGCGKASLTKTQEQENGEKTSEHAKLTEMLVVVNQKMLAIGFNLDLRSIAVQVRRADEMADIFSGISDEEKVDIKTDTSVEPQLSKERFEHYSTRHTTSGADNRLAFYNPNSKTIIFREGASKLLTEGYLAHELAHIYQDQKWGFNNLWYPYQDNPSRELFNITQYIIEGHAELVSQAYLQAHAQNPSADFLTSSNLGKMLTNECATCEREIMANDLPYYVGLRFMAYQYRIGGWPMVDHVFTGLPTSTEQIIHPNKQGSDLPTKLTPLPWHNETIEAELVLEGTLGEGYLLAKLLSLGVPSTHAFLCASGWEGDIARSYRSKDGHEASVWRLIFDRAIDAKQLEVIIKPFVKPEEITRDGRVVDWIISDDTALRKHLSKFLNNDSVDIKSNLSDEKSTADQEISIMNYIPLNRISL